MKTNEVLKYLKNALESSQIEHLQNNTNFKKETIDEIRLYMISWITSPIQEAIILIEEGENKRKIKKLDREIKEMER